MDVPITIGIVVLFVRSGWEVATAGHGAYVDSLCALVFFLLLGRLYQRKTYAAINFDHSYLDYFPIAVTVLNDGQEITRRLAEVTVGDRLLVRNAEIIPADAVLISDSAGLDYSFVTGESHTVNVRSGDRLYAGARLAGPAVKVEVTALPSASRFVRVWRDAAEQTSDQSLRGLADRISRYFTPTVLGLALMTAVVWMLIDSARALDAATAVLIVACPCALALAAPFTLGTVHRLMGRAGLFLRCSDVIERLAGVSSVLFDKTGTVTTATPQIQAFQSETPLSSNERRLIATLTKNSTHPLSRQLYAYLDVVGDGEIEEYREVAGQGIAARVSGREIHVGSDEGDNGTEEFAVDSRVYVAIDGSVRGRFTARRSVRRGIPRLLDRLRTDYRLGLLTGDGAADEKTMADLFGPTAVLGFGQLPDDKVGFVRFQQKAGERVLMLGDGLNDAGALSAANVGISVAESSSAFTPACDAVLNDKSLSRLNSFLDFSRSAVTIVKICFGLSFLYNTIGLVFAAQGLLTPVVAAILMPASSVTVVLVATGLSWLATRRDGVSG
jgi:Cu+-exporting ATPase